MAKTDKLLDYEVQAFVSWVTRKWTAEDRAAFANEFPQIYNKIVEDTNPDGAFEVKRKK